MLLAPATEPLMRKELQRLASKLLVRSVPMLLLPAGFIAYLGWQIGLESASFAVAALGVAVSLWRVHIASLLASDVAWSDRSGRRTAFTLKANAWLTGLMWGVGTLFIYPDLQGIDKTYYVVLTCGYVGVAAFILPMVGPLAGGSFVILTGSQMIILVAVSLFSEGARSIPLAIIAAVYGVAMQIGARTFSRIASRSIERGRELEAANAALKDAIASAAAASQAKSVFLANMSHEIRTPLTAVIGFSEDLLDVDQTMAERVEAARTIHRAGKHLLDVISGVLDLSKIEADRLELEYADVPLLPLIEEVASFARLQATDKGLSFTFKPRFPIPATVRTDPLRVRQILLNLIVNAIKFTDKGSVTIGASYSALDRRLVLSVTDTGIGISEDQRARLFHPFGQADSSISRRFGGTGLGLVLSKRLAELLDGSLDLDSAPGVGSCFSLVLPVQTAGVLHEGPDTPPNAPMQSPHDRQRVPVVGSILLAEDNADNQRLVGQYLRRLGATVDVADNGALALEAAKATPYDLVLMDMQMPVMDGLTAVRRLRDAGYKAAIVALTANATREDMQACLQAGCDAFLAKPIARPSLEQVVRRYLAASTHDTLSLSIDAIVRRGEGLDDDAFDENVDQLLRLLSSSLSTLKAAAEAGDTALIASAGAQLGTAGRRLGCSPAVKIAGQLEFAATTGSLDATWSLIGRLSLLCERIDSDRRRRMLRAAAPAGNGAIVSELLAEGPEMADLVTYFVAKLPEYIERTQNAIESMDFGRIGQGAHDLKSVGGGYGYPMLFELAQAMESAAAAGDAAQITELGDRFEMLAWRIVAGAEHSAQPVIEEAHV
jgi:signal transduction histidine kinase/DNA-binding NarL/FixJ family response regulator/HPt (histidine-containing phosphotransfer) domain-containing protein